MSTTTDTAALASLKEKRLDEILRGMESVLVAYSGGVDSAYLAHAARRVLGDRMLAITAVSPSLGDYQREKAMGFAKQFGIPHLLVPSHEFENEDYLQNTADRCYFCKTELFDILERIAAERGFETIAYGVNADDTLDMRPGHRAAKEKGVRGPLLEAELTKAEIRHLSTEHGLPTGEDSASPCLSSRVPFLERIDPEKIRQIEAGEALLRELGFVELRLRHHGAVARIEVPLAEVPRLLDVPIRSRLCDGLHRLGFNWVTVDLEGFRSGSLSTPFKK